MDDYRASLGRSASNGAIRDSEALRSPMIFGLHTRDSSTESKGSPLLARNKGAGHSSPHDPFIEYKDTWVNTPAASPRVVSPRKHFSWASPSSAGTPATPAFPAFAPPAATTARATYPNLTPTTPSFHFLPSPTRSELLPIPPPPLSSIQGQYTHSPSARARLDAQKIVRETWIRTEAKEIFDLKQAELVAAQTYQYTHSKQDYEAWQRATASLNEATDLEKRMEERRNLFLPVGMEAMRTGPSNAVGDGSAAYPAVNGGHHGGGSGSMSGEGEGRLLGYQMAVMERVCAEVQRRDEDEEDDEISREMLATLSLAEKRALREHLVGRLEARRG
ncbi:uncharacterized protein K460DRAFT_359601 [Cucurbitaria berberidis CBS 394.84]|uniref:Uncharacterized protein n=1 Tax=Cucurbitaria berberidis CBS 394.84 TaxID=1168544 RepID=A0A9P4G8P0_9PLEO|nr:uncharacterized protein K460DRAFT_359601 [Cucurbitaria berberidis CBS 394.84]KAF1841065.1 hypothetical protein K460DRAFT_359601 [Cucurbitaria berberidis CBS 394.84]